MNNPVSAIYEKGVLRLLTPLSLPEQTQVQVYVQPQSTSPEAIAHRRQVQEILLATGLSLPSSLPPDSSLLSAERRAELAELFATGRPLSELILEERTGR